MPKFRLFAGPNGSGKTHLFNYLKKEVYIQTEIYVNADKIEDALVTRKEFNFNAYRVKVSEDDFKKHIKNSGILSKIDNSFNLKQIELKSGILKWKKGKSKLNSYIASFIATYLVEKLIQTGQSFCYETVLSHASKLELLKKASEAGYKTYLYFIITDDWRLNIERVKLRVKQGGHNVDKHKIESRYYKSFENFSKAAKLTDSTFLINNSIDFTLISELKKGKLLKLSNPVPDWFKKYYSTK
jgi:predicted ABC-type ATPase